VLEEKQNVSEDQRKLEMQERLELIKQGNVVEVPPNLAEGSVILREEGMLQESRRARMRSEEANQQQQEVLQEATQQAQQAEQGQQGMHQMPDGSMMPNSEMQQPQGQMPEDPTQAGPAQERLQGGPSAQDIRQQEFAENAPQ
jgi:hypothetical protein